MSRGTNHSTRGVFTDTTGDLRAQVVNPRPLGISWLTALRRRERRFESCRGHRVRPATITLSGSRFRGLWLLSPASWNISWNEFIPRGVPRPASRQGLHADHCRCRPFPAAQEDGLVVSIADRPRYFEAMSSAYLGRCSLRSPRRCSAAALSSRHIPYTPSEPEQWAATMLAAVWLLTIRGPCGRVPASSVYGRSGVPRISR